LLIHLGPKECLIPSSGGNRDYYTKLTTILERNNILVTERKKGFKQFLSKIKFIILVSGLIYFITKIAEFAYDTTSTELNKLLKSKSEQNVANLGDFLKINIRKLRINHLIFNI
jgi:hypothetical protein